MAVPPHLHPDLTDPSLLIMGQPRMYYSPRSDTVLTYSPGGSTGVLVSEILGPSDGPHNRQKTQTGVWVS